MTAKLSAEELAALQRLAEGVMNAEMSTVAQAVALHQLAMACPPATLMRLLQQVREAEARWEALKAWLQTSVDKHETIWADHVTSIMRRLERESPPAKSREAEWQPIETAPKDGAPVLLYYPNRYQGNGGVTWGCFLSGGWTDSRVIDDNDCTHWQPLPPPPASEGSAG